MTQSTKYAFSPAAGKGAKRIGDPNVGKHPEILRPKFGQNYDVK